jgi:hypothetical protein
MRALKLLADCHPKKRAPLLRCCRGAGTCAHSAAVGGGPLMAIRLAAPSEPHSLTTTSPAQHQRAGVQGRVSVFQHCTCCMLSVKVSIELHQTVRLYSLFDMDTVFHRVLGRLSDRACD